MPKENPHEVHASHQENEVDQQQPVSLESDFALFDKSFPDIIPSSPNSLALDIRIGLGQAESENDEEHWRARAKPEERSPPMRSRVDQCTSKHRREQVSKSISLLQHPRNDASGPRRAVFQCCGCGVAVQASHCDTEQGANGEELFGRLTKACSEFQDDEEDVVDYERPLTAVSVGCDSKSDRAHGAEHQY